jgi:hypothetical protein
MEQAIVSLIEFVEKASPIIWEAGRRQVTSSIVTSTIWLILISVGLYVLVRVTKEWWNNLSEPFKKDGDKQFILGLLITVIISGIVIIAFIITGMASRIINPDYYAIRYITYLWPSAGG